MWVVKLGGSLAASPDLPAWLEAVSRHGGGKVILVPGGGALADQVRDLQRRWQFSDAAAHHMALLAMEQYGRMLCDIRAELTPVALVADMQATAMAGGVGVWLPTAMVLAERELPRTWDLTSDSLAAWLARRLGASGLLLVKSVAPAGTRVSCMQLTAEGTVDPLLCGFLLEAPFATWVCGAQDHSGLRSALETGGGCGAAVSNCSAGSGGSACVPGGV